MRRRDVSSRWAEHPFSALRFGVSALAAAALALPAIAAEEKKGDAKPTPIAIAEIERDTAVDFEKDLLPIFNRKCLACHNETKARGDLVLETPQTIREGGRDGDVVVPKKGLESALLIAAAHRAEPVMPPPKNKVGAVPFTPHELGLLKLWIDQGATGEVRGASATPVEWKALPKTVNPIYAVALTPDGQFAACARANQIFLYHVPSGQLISRLTDPALAEDAIYGPAGAAHRDLVQSLAFSPDGGLLASGGYRVVKLWQRPRNVQRHRIENADAGAVTTVAASPDGKWLATGGANHAVKLWDLATGKAARELAGHAAAITSLKFSPDSGTLYSGSDDKSVRAWNVADGALAGKVETPAPVKAVAWLADGQIAAGGADNIIRVFKLPEQAGGDLACVKEIKGHGKAVTSLDTVAPDGKQLISGSEDGTLRHWNVADGKQIRQMDHGAPVVSVAVRADGKRFASAGRNNAAKLWDASDGKQLAECKGDERARRRVAARQRSFELAKGDVAYQKKVFDDAEKRKKSEDDAIKKATEAKEKADKALAEKEPAYKKAKDAKDAADKAAAEAAEAAKKAAAAKDAAAKAVEPAKKDVAAAQEKAKQAKADDEKEAAKKTVADAQAKQKAANDAKAAADKAAGEADKKKKEAGEAAKKLEKPLADADKALKDAQRNKRNADTSLEATQRAVKNAGEAVTVAKAAREVADAAQKEAEADLEAVKKAATEAEKGVRAVAFSPDNRLLATAGDDQTIHTFSAETGDAYDTLTGHAGAVNALAFTAAGALASGAADKTVVVWNVSPAWTLARAIGTGDASSPMVDRVTALDISPDGKLLATGGGEPSRSGELKIWNLADGTLVREVKDAHSDMIFGLDFSRDGKRLASCAADRFVKVFAVETGESLKAFEGHTSYVLDVGWRQDDRTLASCGADNVIKVWDFVSGNQKKTIGGFKKEVTSISFLGITDQTIATAGDPQVKLVRENGKDVRSFGGNTGFVHAAASTADGKLIIAGGADSILRAWNAADGKALASFEPPE